MALSARLLFLILALFMFPLSARADLEDQPMGWYYLGPDGAGYSVYITDDRGRSLPTPVWSAVQNDPDYQQARRVLNAPPRLDVRMTPVAGLPSMTVAELLSSQVESFELGKDGKTHSLGLSEICPDSRTPLGKLLFCLENAREQEEAAAATNDEYARTHTVPSDWNAKTERTRQMIAAVQHAIATLVQAHNVPNSKLAHNFHNHTTPDDANTAQNPGLSPFRHPRGYASPLRTGPGGGFTSDYFDCFWKQGEAAPFRYADDIACRSQGTPIDIYAPELQQIFRGTTAHAFAQSYFEALRMEAISRTLDADYSITGFTQDVNDMPGHCGPFREGFKRFIKKAKDAPRLPPPAEVQTAAREISQGAAVARQLNRYVRMCSVGLMDPQGQPCQPGRLAASIHELDSLKSAILDRLVKYPYLRVGHSASDEVFEGLPTVDKFVKAGPNDLQRVMNTAVYGVHTDFRNTLQKFCDSDRPDSDWDRLVNMPEITGPVLEKFPEFAKVQECAQFRFGQEQYNSMLGGLLLGFGCAIGSVVPGVGPACAAYYLGAAAVNYGRSARELAWTQACLSTAAGDGAKAICKSQDYLNAREAYDSAVTDLVLNGVFAGVEGVGKIAESLSAIRAQAREAKDVAELEQRALRLRQSRSLEEAQAVARGEAAGGAVVLDGGVNAPRNAEGAMDFDRIPPSDIQAYRQRPPVTLRAQPTEADLLGRASTGAGEPGQRLGGVYKATTSDGRQVAVKVFGDFTVERLGGVDQAEEALVREMAQAKELERIGVGPKVYGTTRLPDGRLGMVMDVVDGHFETEAGAFINDRTYKDAQDIIEKLRKNGYGPGPDFQLMVRPDGQAVVIDATMLRPLSQCTETTCTNADRVISSLRRQRAAYDSAHPPTVNVSQTAATRPTEPMPAQAPPPASQGHIDFDHVSETDLEHFQRQNPVELTSHEPQPFARGSSSAGEGGGVFRGRVRGVDHDVAIKTWGDLSIRDNGGMTGVWAKARRELMQAKELERMGLGPKVYGLVTMPGGRPGLVMDMVEGGMMEGGARYINATTHADVDRIFQTLQANGYAVGGDFQVMIRPDGHAIVVDAENLKPASWCAQRFCETADGFNRSLTGVRQEYDQLITQGLTPDAATARMTGSSAPTSVNVSQGPPPPAPHPGEAGPPPAAPHPVDPGPPPPATPPHVGAPPATSPVTLVRNARAGVTRTEGVANHLFEAGYLKPKGGGVYGAHRLDLLEAALGNRGRIEDVRNVEGLPGVQVVRYKLYRLNRGKVTTELANADLMKTVFDPTIWPPDRVEELARSVFGNVAPLKDGGVWVQRDGITFEGFIRNGKLDSFGVRLDAAHE